MKLGTRLLLPLLVAVALVMSLYGAWALRQRQTTLVAEARRETRAYATALGLALESAFRDPDLKDVQQIIDRISREPKIYGVLVYGPDGRSLFVSDPLGGTEPPPAGVLRRVLARGDTASFEREIDGQRVYSVLHAVRAADGAVVAAFEVAQPLAFVEAEKARTSQRFLLNTFTLLAAVTILILWLVRRSITSPLERFVTAAQALGRGDLAHRIREDAGAGELALLAGELNRMANRLEGARSKLVQEAEERIALERRLRETERLAAVGNLAAGLAHEIASPLHVIRGRAEMLLRRDGLPEAQARNLRIIVEQIGRITVIVRNLLDFARRREPRIEALDLGLVLEGVAEFVESEFARTGVRLDWEGPRALATRGDPHLLHQVFMNLLLNARQALDDTEGERRVVIRTRMAGEAEVVGESRETAPAVVVEVEDTGPGIPGEVLPHIFEPFFTTKPGGVGTGLGLAVARSIVEEHGGSLEAENVHGEGGARFRVTLPGWPTPATSYA
ncbi:MAG: HAMP domain-containing protein [Gemmatimonadetes bacterium]|nr:HAMP domain-containing protein [Gemmatimonadota bacterium]